LGFIRILTTLGGNPRAEYADSGSAGWFDILHVGRGC
jgi:hypothetical protein